MDSKLFFTELDKVLVDKFSKDMKEIHRKLEMQLYQDACGVTIPQSDDINLTLCKSCGVVHQDRCELKELSA